MTAFSTWQHQNRAVPRAKIVRMLLSVAVEAGLGVFPQLGDLLDVVWKANLRNVAIIDQHFGMIPGRW